MRQQTLVSQEELMQATGYERPGDLRKWLDREGLTYKLGKGGRVLTTVDALNRAFAEDSDREGWEIA